MIQNIPKSNGQGGQVDLEKEQPWKSLPNPLGREAQPIGQARATKR